MQSSLIDMDTRSLHYNIMTDEDTYEPLDEEMVRQAIGGILPDDILDSMQSLTLTNQNLPEEDIDIFSSGGGFEMDGEIIPTESRKSSNSYLKNLGADSTSFNKDTYMEHPSRTLFVRSINSNVEDSELRALFEPFGDIRSLYTTCKHRGFVMVSYFDIRAARTAMQALHNKQLRNKKLDIHFSFPKDNPSDKDINQGTLVIFNLNPSITSDYLHELFGKYGEVKEIRGSPHKSHHRFIEFYDIRDAESALKGLNKAVIGGRQIKLELSHPGILWSSTEYHGELPEQVTYRSYDTQSTSPLLSFSPGPWEQMGKSMESGSQGSVRYSPRSWNHRNGNNHFDMKRSSPYHTSSLPEYNNDILSFHSLPQDLSRQDMRSKTSLPDSPTFHSLLHMEHTQSLNCSYGSHTASTVLHRSNQNRLSFITKNSPSVDKQFSYSRNSPDTPLYGPGSFGSSVPMMKNISPIYNNGIIKEDFGRLDHQNSGMGSLPHHQHGSLTTNYGNYDVFCNQTQGIEGNGSQSDLKNVYRLDLKRIMLGEDTRTTLMIKNIPNKYTVEMLLEAIDQTHRGTYDFMYLPIDFKNNCNVGYAFINMTSPMYIVSLYKALDGRKWERFNSEKVASLAYARIQGRTALVSHFQNSSLMNEEGRCQPILFDREGRRSPL